MVYSGPAYQKRKGFSLLELLMSLAIGMLIAGTAYTIYRSAKNDQLVKQTYDIGDTIFQDAQDITSTENVFVIDNVGGGSHDVTVGDLVNAKGGIENFPKGTVLVDSATLGHPFGGDILVTAESTNGTDKDLIALEFTQIPDGQCLHFLSKMSASSVYDMYVNGSLVGLTPAATASSIGRDQVRMDQASALCDEENYVDIKVRKLKEIRYNKMRAGPYGASMSTGESAVITPLFNRQEAALTAREAAQLAIP